jgi:hypothetical protein
MPEFDLTERLMEQAAPIIETMMRRIQTDLTDRDKAAIAHAIVGVGVVGARVAYGMVLANAAEAGIELPASINLDGLRDPDLWPFED